MVETESRRWEKFITMLACVEEIRNSRKESRAACHKESLRKGKITLGKFVGRDPLGR